MARWEAKRSRASCRRSPMRTICRVPPTPDVSSIPKSRNSPGRRNDRRSNSRGELAPMRLGIWTPLPHTIRPERRMEQAIAQLKEQGSGHGPDASFEFAVDILQQAERHDFDISLIAARQLGPDLEAWTLASALASRTTNMELMVAVHPGINTPQMVAKMGASLDRISGGRFSVNVVNGWN